MSTIASSRFRRQGACQHEGEPPTTRGGGGGRVYRACRMPHFFEEFGRESRRVGVEPSTDSEEGVHVRRLTLCSTRESVAGLIFPVISEIRAAVSLNPNSPRLSARTIAASLFVS